VIAFVFLVLGFIFSAILKKRKWKDAKGYEFVFVNTKEPALK
jgi:hypothetical protein